MSEQLASWHDTATREAIVDFVERVTTEGGPDYVPPAERIAVYDNDGTLWCEKPMPIELGFILMRLAEMAEQDESLRTKQPWQAAYDKDYAWLGEAITKHYHGDDDNLKVLMGGILAGVRWPERRALLERRRRVPAGRQASDARPVVPRVRLPADDRAAALPRGERLHELHRLRRRPRLHAPGHRGDLRHPLGARDRQLERARVHRRRARRHVSYEATGDFFDDGPVKPVRIWSRIGKRPILAAGNSNGDIPMLRYAGGKGRPALRLLLLHDDDEREFAYTAGAETSLQTAAEQRLDGRQHQERLGDRVRRLSPRQPGEITRYGRAGPCLAPGSSQMTAESVLDAHQVAGAVLIEVAREPDLPVREIAGRVGLTDRHAYRMLADLGRGLSRARAVGAKLHYRVDPKPPMGHPALADRRVGELLLALAGTERSGGGRC